MGHKVFIRHTYIYKCSNKDCGGEWKINEASNLEIIKNSEFSFGVNYLSLDSMSQLSQNIIESNNILVHKKIRIKISRA